MIQWEGAIAWQRFGLVVELLAANISNRSTRLEPVDTSSLGDQGTILEIIYVTFNLNLLPEDEIAFKKEWKKLIALFQ
jgi:hypothetical protein